MARPSHTAMSPVTGTEEFVTHWERGERGSADRYQMRMYATNVAIAMGMAHNGDELECIHCGMTFNISAMGDVDRVRPIHGYLPGNVIMTCRMCNETRGFMQQGGVDFAGIDRYQQDVLSASANVHVPSKKDAAAWRTPFNGVVRQRVGGVHWTIALSASPYWK